MAAKAKKNKSILSRLVSPFSCPSLNLLRSVNQGALELLVKISKNISERIFWWKQSYLKNCHSARWIYNCF